MNWLKKLFSPTKGSRPEKSTPMRIGDLELVPSAVSNDRAEAAMPGTAELPPLLELVPPPITLEPAYATEHPDEREYGPNPQVAITVRFPAATVFPCKAIENALYGDLHHILLRPTYYVVTLEGRTSYLTASDAPPEGCALIASWSLGLHDNITPEAIGKAREELTARLAALPYGFGPAKLDLAKTMATFSLVERIKGLSPDSVTIIAYQDDNQPFIGKQVWNLLHSMGFRWGDMDCFQWVDPTGQTDYLIWVEADDGVLGYVLPEMVASGEQNFFQVRFSISVPRTPSPLHVLDQMIRAAGAFQAQTSCKLAAMVDDETVEGTDQLREATSGLVAEIEEMNLKPGSSEICIVR